MWFEYLKDVKDYDEGITDEWKEDANGVLVFVSPDLLVLIFAMTSKSEDRDLLSDHRFLHHEKLQNAIP